MLILELIKQPLNFLGFVLALITSMTIHEAAHAWMANKLGDPTPKMLGRLSLNPLRHIDLIGTLFFFLVGFGWGNPVPFNPLNFKNPRLDTIKVSLAGPLSNFLLALVLTFIYRFLPSNSPVAYVILIVISLSIVWMIFNLLPIPPLDGSHLLKIFISPKLYQRLQIIGFPLLLILLFFSPIVHNFISVSLALFFKIFLGQSFSPF